MQFSSAVRVWQCRRRHESNGGADEDDKEAKKTKASFSPTLPLHCSQISVFQIYVLILQSKIAPSPPKPIGQSFVPTLLMSGPNFQRKSVLTWKHRWALKMINELKNKSSTTSSTANQCFSQIFKWLLHAVHNNAWHKLHHFGQHGPLDLRGKLSPWENVAGQSHGEDCLLGRRVVVGHQLSQRLRLLLLLVCSVCCWSASAAESTCCLCRLALPREQPGSTHLPNAPLWETYS